MELSLVEANAVRVAARDTLRLLEPIAAAARSSERGKFTVFA